MEFGSNQRVIELKDLSKNATTTTSTTVQEDDEEEIEVGTSSTEKSFKDDFKETLNRSRNGLFRILFSMSPVS